MTTPSVVFPLQIAPYTATINASGQGLLSVGHSLHGMIWEVQQIGFALGQLAPSPQIAAHVNGLPLTATVAMQPSVFSSIAGQVPYAMESFMVGPPYVFLSSGDMITCGVIGATAGDIFTVAAFYVEHSSDVQPPMDPKANYRPGWW